jgi:hypothetical protein
MPQISHSMDSVKCVCHIYPLSGNLTYIYIAIEHGPFIVDLPIYLLNMVIFHSYVSLPEGIMSLHLSHR